MIIIHKPRFRADTGRREIGLAVDKVLREREIVEVMIDYKRKDGSLLYPNKFEISRAKLKGWPEQVVHGTRLIIVPIDEFKEVIVR